MGVSEEPDKKSDLNESKNKGLVSLAGLAIVGVALLFGLPYIQKTLKKAIGKEGADLTTEVVETEKDTEVTEEKDLDGEMKVVKGGEEEAGTLSQSELEALVDGSIVSALRPSYREGYQISLVKSSAKTNKVLVEFIVREESYEVVYSFDEAFQRYVGKLESEMKTFFSRSPAFEVK